MASHFQSQQSDAVSIAQLDTGDIAALEVLFRAHYSDLVDFAVSLVGVDDAEEVVCDVFAALGRAGRAPKVRTSLRAYLFGAVRHAALNRRRSERRAIARHEVLGLEAHESVVSAPMPAPDEMLIANEERQRLSVELVRSLAQLPQTARSVVAFRVRQGLSYAEIAEVMGTTENAAKMQFSRAVAKLRRLMAIGTAEGEPLRAAPRGS